MFQAPGSPELDKQKRMDGLYGSLNYSIFFMITSYQQIHLHIIA